MSTYTTGELAKACDVSVRTVQYYDKKDLLKPTSLSENGRRLYTEEDLTQLRRICLLKSLGLSLNAIKGVLSNEEPHRILKLLLNEQAEAIEKSIEAERETLRAIKTVQADLLNAKKLPETLNRGIDQYMNSHKSLKRTHAKMLIFGIPLDIIQIVTLCIGIFKGFWWPFCGAIVISGVTAAFLVQMYYREVRYICPECNTVFRPNFREFFFAGHTAKTRKLTCTACHTKTWCVETAAEENTPHTFS